MEESEVSCRRLSALALVLTVKALVVELVWLVVFLPRPEVTFWPVLLALSLAAPGCLCAGIARDKGRRHSPERRFAKSVSRFSLAVLGIGFIEAALLLWRSTPLRFY